MSKIIDILESVKAIIKNGHFVGTSGRHFDTYVNKDMLLARTTFASDVGKLFSKKYEDSDIEVVIAPAVGGIVLSQWTAFHLTQLNNREVLGVFTEKTSENDQIFKRNFGKLLKGKRCLVVEDATTTGGSVKKVVESVKKAGGILVEACVMVNREPTKVNSKLLGFPFSQLEKLEVESYEEDKCPLCKKNVPISTEVGHGKEFLKRKKDVSI